MRTGKEEAKLQSSYSQIIGGAAQDQSSSSGRQTSPKKEKHRTRSKKQENHRVNLKRKGLLRLAIWIETINMDRNFTKHTVKVQKQ